MAHIEKWRLVDGMYWAVVTNLTIGYGDIVPATHLGRSLIIPYATCGIVMLGLVAGSVGSLVLDRVQKKMSMSWIIREKERLEVEAKKPHPEDATEMEKERREFILMRRIQSRATSMHRWTLLGISIFALFMLWLLGAAVFWGTENAANSFQSQPWSYFDAIYFMFISMVTIGYGDFAVHSEIGRPLFVFWALLAIPTITILIASMGATVLILIKGIIQRIDNFVVLPHEGGGKDGERTSFTRKAFHHAKLKHKVRIGHKGPGKEGDGHDGHVHGHEVHGTGVRDPNTGRIMHMESHLADVPHVDHDHDEAVSMRNYLLAKEIRGIFEDMTDSTKKYSYEEWARFLQLLGIKHRPMDTAERVDENAAVRNSDMSSEWDWLGPLFSRKSEPEWVLDRLTKQLMDNLTPDDLMDEK